MAAEFPALPLAQLCACAWKQPRSQDETASGKLSSETSKTQRICWHAQAKGGVQTSGDEQSMMGRLVRCPRWPQPSSALLPTQTLPLSASRAPVGCSSWAPRGCFSLKDAYRGSTAGRQVVHDRRIRDMLRCGKKTQGHPG